MAAVAQDLIKGGERVTPSPSMPVAVAWVSDRCRIR